MDHVIIALTTSAALLVLSAGSVQAQALPVVSYPSGLHGTEAIARRARDGHFYIDASVGDASVPMLVDTGAGRITLRAEDAEKAGINPSSLTYSVRVMTGNGIGHAAPVVISSMTVGGVTRRNVAAWVSEPGKLSISLLGQSFLTRLAGFKVDGNQMVLQGE